MKFYSFSQKQLPIQGPILIRRNIPPRQQSSKIIHNILAPPITVDLPKYDYVDNTDKIDELQRQILEDNFEILQMTALKQMSSIRFDTSQLNKAYLNAVDYRGCRSVEERIEGSGEKSIGSLMYGNYSKSFLKKPINLPKQRVSRQHILISSIKLADRYTSASAKTKDPAFYQKTNLSSLTQAQTSRAPTPEKLFRAVVPLNHVLKIKRAPDPVLKKHQSRQLKLYSETISRLGKKITQPVKLKTYKPVPINLRQSIHVYPGHVQNKNSSIYSPSNSLMRSKLL